MNKKIASLLMASALSLSLIAPALAFDPPPSGDTTPSIDGSGNITWEITDPNAPSNPGTTTPGGSSGSGGGSYVPPAKPSVTIDKQSSGAGTFNVSVGANPFVDVQPGAFFYDAVLWAVQKGITTGTSATTFGPGEGCTRGQIVTFLYRAS